MESWHKHASSFRNGTEWQKEPSTECKKEQLSYQFKADYQTNGGTVRWNAIITRATYMTKRPMARQHSRKDMVDNWRTTNPVRDMGWAHPNYDEGQVKNPSRWTKNVEGNILRLRATCGGRLVKWRDDSRLWRFARIRSRRNLRQKIQIPRSIRKRTLRIFVRKRNSKTSEWTKTIIDSGRTLSKKMMLKSKKTTKVGRVFKNSSIDVMKNFVSDFTTWWDKLKRVLTMSLQIISMYRSEGCQYFWGVDQDYKISDPANKTSWRPDRKWPQGWTQWSKN